MRHYGGEGLARTRGRGNPAWLPVMRELQRREMPNRGVRGMSATGYVLRIDRHGNIRREAFQPDNTLAQLQRCVGG